MTMMNVTDAITKTKTNEYQRSGTVGHHAHKSAEKWLHGARGTRLDPKLMDEGWRCLKHPDRTPVNGLILGGGLLQRCGYDQHKTDYLVKGFREGFHLRLDTSVEQIVMGIGRSMSRSKSNHKSARVYPMAVEEKLRKEHRAKRMIGPFPNPIFNYYVTSQLGLREKKTPGKFRLIHDLSAPFGEPSVNSHIPMEAGTVSYDTVDTAISLIQTIGLGAVLAKSFGYQMV